MSNPEVATYKDAIYHVKRGFIIIGLTGYTGSGCTTARRLLESKAGLCPPDLGELLSGEPSPRDRLLHRKLSTVWRGLQWTPFTSIEVSKVIFALACVRALSEDVPGNEAISHLRVAIAGHEQILTRLRLLHQDVVFNDADAGAVLEAFRLADRLFSPFKQRLNKSLPDFIETMQDFGDQIRRYGTVSPPEAAIPQPKHLFVIPEAVRRIVKAHQSSGKRRHFVIDAFRNPYEVEYFKRRYSEFYLLGVFRNSRSRHASLQSHSCDQIQRLDSREKGGTVELSRETVSEWMTTQNVEQCLRKADFFVDNADDSTSTYPHLRHSLIKLISLAKQPGCIPPTDDERSMQMAMTARQMSGCISRQVGAIVVGEDGFVIGVGWNDPPSGQIPCALRTGRDLVDGVGDGMFSTYEKSAEFVGQIKERHDADRPFCFRTEYGLMTSQKRAEYTRALHAEENALLQALRNAGERINGGTLYTTASTCTLCAKKAYELGIKRIVYIDEYPGIAIEQTIQTGQRSISTEQFEGISGSAYYWLYEGLLPEKDLIELYGM